ncbi:adenosylhomocysteinase [Streptomyces albogriseolus]|uniref:adenosylhomocysteinase n=1 Tax=Streptomyces albogriseolus TaxID=1887 RepID=UPI001674082B|nr:adenosylhomocysteinase [Streptomyces viridodiastaticus]MCX4570715.1 adenosylhomocysteinase [Streptomyces viridodiastaticus]GHG01652.1 adenosylhomocysteinase [Streptomyces viridodiastaticus]
MESPERVRLDAFFRQITTQFPADDAITTLVITHLLPERPAFLRAMTAVSTVGAVLPKPRSIHQPTLDAVRRTFPVHDLTRERFTDNTQALDYLEDTAGGRDVVLVDIGGYFAASLDTLVSKFSGRVLGVVEDTENGHQRYAALHSLPCPIVSVARSPLKDCEDHLVGRSIVFSTDALVRARGDILTSRNACVIGFGKIGRAIAQTLRAQDLRVTVYDNDPIKRVQAHSLGFRTSASTAEAVRDAELVLCATGNLALRQGDFAALRNGAYLGSVTSSEDELELGSLHDLYQRSPVSAQLTRYEVTGHYFYVLADGGAVNFVHGAAVGAYIHLVQAEILAATAALSHARFQPGLHEMPAADRGSIATTWLHHFER